MREHEFEPVPGLPEALPEGEQILWQGAPEWRAFAQQAFHLRGLALYFALLAVWRAATVWEEGAVAVVLGMAWIGLLGSVVIGLLLAVGWLGARSTLYTVTNRRVVLRVGIALPMTINLPFVAIREAGMRLFRDGTGEIRLVPAKGQRVSWIALWPHSRGLSMMRPQPVLRALPDAERAGQVLARALAASAAMPAPMLHGAADAGDARHPTAAAAA